MTVGKSGRRKHEGIRPASMTLEVKALAILMDYWATTKDADRRKHLWCNRLPALRAAIQVGLEGEKTRRGPKGEEFPHELVADEYHALLPLAQWLREARPSTDHAGVSKWLADVEIPVAELGICRRCPCPEDHRDDLAWELAIPKAIPSEAAFRMVAWRFGTIAASTVEVNRAKEDRPEHKRSSLQKALASLYLDLSSYEPTPAHLALQARILDALFASGYEARMLYYLVQVGHKIPDRITVALTDSVEVTRLCDELDQRDPKEPVEGPFTRLMGIRDGMGDGEVA